MPDYTYVRANPVGARGQDIRLDFRETNHPVWVAM